MRNNELNIDKIKKEDGVFEYPKMTIFNYVDYFTSLAKEIITNESKREEVIEKVCVEYDYLLKHVFNCSLEEVKKQTEELLDSILEEIEGNNK